MGIDTYQKLNDGPSNLAIICALTVQGAGAVAKGMVDFYPKTSSNWSLTVGGPSTFHLLTPGGAPFTPASPGVYDDGHHTTHSGWIGVWLPAGHGLPDGTVTWLVTNDDPNAIFAIQVN